MVLTFQWRGSSLVSYKCHFSLLCHIKHQCPLSERESSFENFCSLFSYIMMWGRLAGLASSAATFPFEVVRKRMMVGAVVGKRTPRNFGHTVQLILEEEGVRGLYQGIAASSLKVMPASGLSWMFYEKCKQLLHVDNNFQTWDTLATYSFDPCIYSIFTQLSLLSAMQTFALCYWAFELSWMYP